MLGIVAGMDKKDCYVVTLLLTCLLFATTGALSFRMLKTAVFPHVQLVNKVIHIPVVVQRPIFMVQPCGMTMEIPQLLVDNVVDFPAWQVVQVSQVVVRPQLQSIFGRRHSLSSRRGCLFLMVQTFLLTREIPQLVLDVVVDVPVVGRAVFTVVGLEVAVVIPQLPLLHARFALGI